MYKIKKVHLATIAWLNVIDLVHLSHEMIGPLHLYTQTVPLEERTEITGSGTNSLIPRFQPRAVLCF